jgi:hypothetical protein
MNVREGNYFEMIGPAGDRRGRMKVTHSHLTGKTLTYRPAKWHERLWLWLSRKQVDVVVLHY